MKKLVFGLFLSTCLFTSLQAQVKIGENPQNLDANSVLELESTTKALVITRLSTLQMDAMTPLNGALIYNTDTNCVHYYNGTIWINLCEAENAGDINLVESPANTFTFTNAAGDDITFETPEFTDNYTGTVAGLPSGIRVTDDGNTVNIEIRNFPGRLINENSINADRLTDRAVTNLKLGDGSVSEIKIQDEAVTTTKIRPGTNNQVLKTVGSNVEWGTLDAASIAGQDLTVDATLEFTGSTTGVGALIETVGISVADGGITNAKLAPDAVTSDKIINATIVSDDLADNAVITSKITDANVTASKIAADAIDNTKLADAAVQTENILDGRIATLDIADDAVTADKIGSAGAADANKILGTSAAGDPEWQNASQIAASLGEDVISSNGSISGVAVNAALAAMDLEVNVDDTTIEVDATNGLQIVAGSIDNTKLTNDAVTGAKILDASIESNDIADKNITLSKLADGTTLGQLMQWDGTNWVLVDAATLTADGLIGNEVTGPTDATLQLNGAGTLADPLTLDVSTGGINTAELATDAVTTDKLTDANVTRDKIADLAINDAKLDKTTISLTGFAVPTADLSIGSQKLTNVLNPTDAQDAATKFYVDAAVTAGTTALALKENSANKSNDGTLVDNSVTDFPTEQAVKTYVDSKTVSGTTGSIFFADATGQATENNSQLFWDNPNNRLGIGRTNPQDKLDVEGQIRARDGFAATGGTVGQPSYGFYTNGDTNTGMFRIAEDQIGFSVGGTQALKIEEDSGETNVTVNGAFSTRIKSINSGTTAILEVDEHTVILSGAVTNVTFPTSASLGQVLILKNITITPLTASINFINDIGASTSSLPIGVTQLQYDGANWQQIN
ncbi:hypothetical protein M4I21_14840 [Cellulophaga sp. 20_2_10]|uniref:hypothetical protein n=1 Tax=Cellulophaga sp. 20_2_10 TaxID=2942476 RepID=UPI00201B06FD|nr:hypothetical protein [Cellulophaga sp. 20_2_10]MCL5247096.1 hypothetical protein [Cellulophaga sp. 20_2_10]